MGIVRKNFLIVTSMMVATFLLILGLLYFVMPVYYNQAKQQELKQSYLSIVKELNGQSEAEIRSKMSNLDQKEPNLYLLLEDAEGEILYPDAPIETVYIQNENYDQIGAWTEVITSREGQTFTLQGEYAFQSLSDISQTLVTFYPFVLVLVFLLVSVVALIYSRLSNRRITAISETTRQMQSLEPSLSCLVEGHDEVARLAENINALYRHLLGNMEELKRENERTQARRKQEADFVRMTSHELKTPIASMLGLVEGMLYNVGDFQNHDKYLQQCREILQEQSNLVQSVLDATTLDIGEQKETEFELAEAIRRELGPSLHLAQLKQLQLEMKWEPLLVRADQTILLKAIKNIIDNAIRYTVEGGLVRITLKDHQLLVENQAERLLRPDELEQIFQPFYRPDYSRSKKDGGTGIGLYLVQQVLDKHGFAYQFEAVDGNRMRFTIDFEAGQTKENSGKYGC